jgi:hypothetical protein
MDMMRRNNVSVSGIGIIFALMRITRRCPATSAPSATIGIFPRLVAA